VRLSFLKQFIVILTFLFLSVSVSAKDYDVEVVVFANEDFEFNQSEVWVSQLETLDFTDAVTFTHKEQEEGYAPHPASMYELATARELLKKSGRFEIIKHIRWRQPGLGTESAKPVRIRGGTEFQLRRSVNDTADTAVTSQMTHEVDYTVIKKQLDGTVKIVLSRYLHVYVNLILRKPVVTEVTDAEQEIKHIATLQDFRLYTHRKMRSNELHYIDHPMLGILIQITPVEEDETTTEPLEAAS